VLTAIVDRLKPRCLCLSGWKPSRNAFSNANMKVRGSIDDDASKGRWAPQQKFVLTRQACACCVDDG